MPETDLTYFFQLKSEIASTLSQSYPVNADIKTWKGQDISNFQEDLMTKVQGRISEKWFYTHLKNDHDKLPRIDMLNLLCQYCGYKNWTDFKSSVQITSQDVITQKPQSRYSRLVLAGVVFISILIYSWLSAPETIIYQFCFIDADRKQPISHQIDIIELRSNESPIQHHTDSSGCFTIQPQDETLTFVIRSAYYKTDTITRVITQSGQENIQVKTNDYALMIHIFSNSKIEDWKKRRRQLSQMIANNCKIYQIDSEAQVNIDWYNKTEFINKMTMPVNSLKNIEILETIYENDQIIEMRFRQVNNK